MEQSTLIQETYIQLKSERKSKNTLDLSCSIKKATKARWPAQSGVEDKQSPDSCLSSRLRADLEANVEGKTEGGCRWRLELQACGQRYFLPFSSSLSLNTNAAAPDPEAKLKVASELHLTKSSREDSSR
ncbi:hypothetical protein SESBI_47332 [Sesbania bispinosa]|nr:hypothetical protein SESBI_47332 [Sesbania bispinosa]